MTTSAERATTTMEEKGLRHQGNTHLVANARVATEQQRMTIQRCIQPPLSEENWLCRHGNTHLVAGPEKAIKHQRKKNSFSHRRTRTYSFASILRRRASIRLRFITASRSLRRKRDAVAQPAKRHWVEASREIVFAFSYMFQTITFWSLQAIKDSL